MAFRKAKVSRIYDLITTVSLSPNLSLTPCKSRKREQKYFPSGEINIFDEKSGKLVALVSEDDVEPAEVVRRPDAVAVDHLKRILNNLDSNLA